MSLAIDAALSHLREPPKIVEPSPLYAGFVRVGRDTVCPCGCVLGAGDWGMVYYAPGTAGEISHFTAKCRGCGRQTP